MTDKPDPLPILDPYNIQITFASTLITIGHWNGVVNVTLGCPRFSPLDTVSQPQPDIAITSRLRMDLSCAQALYEQLGKIISQVAIAPANATTH